MNDDYFKKWLDERFKELGNKIDALGKSTDREIILIKERIKTLEENDKWQNQKIWLAMGAITIITGFAVYFLASFKSLNEYQVQKAVSQALKDFNFK